MSGEKARLGLLFRGLNRSDPPAPWRLTYDGPVGGFTSLGFAPDSELLLVASSGGRGLIDAATGRQVARDRAPDPRNWEDPAHLTVKGIGPLTGQEVRVAGIPGGGLPLGTEDGWRLEVIPLDWTESVALLCPEWTSPFVGSQFDRCVCLHHGWPLTVAGFSSTGRSLVLMEGEGVRLSFYHR